MKLDVCKYNSTIFNNFGYCPDNFYQRLLSTLHKLQYTLPICRVNSQIQAVQRHNGYLPVSISGFAVALTSIVLFA